MFENKENKQCIEGITCDVENCIHNNHECGCTAKNIHVGPHSAHTCSETVCESYKSQE